MKRSHWRRGSSLKHKKSLLRRTPLRKTRRVKSLRKRLWPEFSKLIRARDGRCLKGPQGCGGVLTASHIYPKGSWPLLELYPLNCLTLCWRHHLHWWHKNPVEASEWLVTVWTLPQLAELGRAKRLHLERKGWAEADYRAEWKRHGLGSHA